MKTHIPRAATIAGVRRTMCGRLATAVACIDIARDCIDDATCNACHRSDDAWCLAVYRAECRAAGLEP